MGSVLAAAVLKTYPHLKPLAPGQLQAKSRPVRVPVAPAPSQLWVFIDEREDSINDGYFVVRMEGYDPRTASAFMIGNYPASYHAGSGGLSFADGHSEIHKWRDPRTMPQLRKGQLLPIQIASPNNLDMEWLMERASSKIQNPTRQ